MSIQSTDQFGNKIEIAFPPQRIISLVPSQTEFLFDIGLSDQIVGITKYCTHPADVINSKAKIGGTKRFHIEKIKQLQPDLIIGNKEENYKEGIDELSKIYPVWMSDIFNLNNALNMMQEIGRITDREKAALQLVEVIKKSFAHLENELNSIARKPHCAYFIWRKPYMVAASNTFINEMLSVNQMINVFSNIERYPEIDPDTLKALDVDYIFLSSEPYSFSEKHLDEFHEFAPSCKVVLVDGEMFSWYGSRLKYAADYFLTLRSQL